MQLFKKKKSKKQRLRKVNFSQVKSLVCQKPESRILPNKRLTMKVQLQQRAAIGYGGKGRPRKSTLTHAIFASQYKLLKIKTDLPSKLKEMMQNVHIDTIL